MSNLYNVTVVDEENDHQEVALQSSIIPNEAQLKVILSLFKGDTVTVERCNFDSNGRREQVCIYAAREEYLLKDFDLNNHVQAKGRHTIEEFEKEGNDYKFHIPIEDFSIVIETEINIIDNEDVEATVNKCYVLDEDSITVDYAIKPSMLVILSEVLQYHVSENKEEYINK